MAVISSDDREVRDAVTVLDVEPEENPIMDSAQGVPSEVYETFTFSAVIFLIFDFLTDIIVGIYTIWTGRFVQGLVSILITIFPMIFNCVSQVYRYQYGLIKMDEVYDEEDRDLRCKVCLPGRIIDSIIWAYNHYVQTVQYRQDLSDEKKRRKFYLSKQMAQITLKNEAKFEAYLQVVWTLFGLIYNYDEYTVSSKILVIGSMTFSLISIARAACIDLKKTQFRFRKEQYPTQTCCWKISRLISVIGATIARIVSNVVFILYCVQVYSEEGTGYTIYFFSLLFCYFFFTVNILWMLDSEFLMNDVASYAFGMLTPFFFSAALPLEMYTYSIMWFMLMVINHFGSIIPLFLLILWLNELASTLFIILTSSFITSVALCIIFTGITRMLTTSAQGWKFKDTIRIPIGTSILESYVKEFEFRYVPFLLVASLLLYALLIAVFFFYS